MPKIERSSSNAAKVQSVSRPAVASAAAPAAPATNAPPTGWGPKAARPQKELAPAPQGEAGEPVAKTASPDALWGEQPQKVDLDFDNFKELSPAEQKKVVEAALIERAQLSTDISRRVEVLDRRWKSARLSTRTEALREFHDRGGRKLDRRTRHRLEGLVGRSEESQRRINELRAKIDALPKTPEAKVQQKALRDQLANELRRARDEQSKVVKEATELVDAQGLKIDRLAETEQIIDPSAPPPGSGQSLLEQIARFFHLDSFFDFFRDMARDFIDSFGDEVEKRGKRLEDEGKEKELNRMYLALEERTRNVTKDVERARELVSSLREPSATLSDA